MSSSFMSISMIVAGAVAAGPVPAGPVPAGAATAVPVLPVSNHLPGAPNADENQQPADLKPGTTTTEILPQVSGVLFGYYLPIRRTITSSRDSLQAPVSQELDAASLVISPGHQLIAGAARDGSLWIWGYGDQRRPEGPLVISGAANTFAFLPGCNQLAAVGNNTRVHLWSTDDGSLIHGWQTGHRQITSIAVHPSLKRMVTAGREGQLNVWDTESGRLRYKSRVYESPVVNLAIRPDGKFLAAAYEDGEVRVWDAESGTGKYSYRDSNGTVRRLVFSPDSTRLAAAVANQSIVLLDAETGNLVTRFEGGEVLEYTPSGEWLITTNQSRDTLIIKSAQTGEDVSSSAGMSRISSVSVTEDSGHLLIVDGSGQLRVVPLKSTQELIKLAGHTRECVSVSFSPDGQRVATAGRDGLVRLWDAHTGAELGSFAGSSSFECVVFSRDGRQLAAGGTDAVVVWDCETGQELHKLTVLDDTVTEVAFCPTGRFLAAGFLTGKVQIWNTADLKEEFSFSTQDRSIEELAWRPDGNRLVVACNNGPGCEVNLATRQVLPLQFHGKPIELRMRTQTQELSVISWHDSDREFRVNLIPEVLPAASVLAALELSMSLIPESVPNSVSQMLPASAAGVDVPALTTSVHDYVAEWRDNLQSPHNTTILVASERKGFAGTISDDGELAVIGGEFIRVWDCKSGEEVLKISGGKGYVFALAISPDGKQIAAAAGDGNVWIYNREDWLRIVP